MEKIKNNFVWIFAAISLIVLFIPKGNLKDYINWALLIIMLPLLILRIIKAFKENSKEANTRIITDFVFILLVLFFGYLYKQSEF
ncbi:hypothetical protein [Flavobacterium sp. LB1P62]|uniref:hypothetical protein n=1 Tax=unclassified Flavobacterium TaxID=196869 RepID=UPI003AAABD17